MLRSLLAVLLLANYLLVVGAGLGVSRAEAPRYSAANPYVHSKHCQQENYLRLDCFEHCNGAPETAKAKLPAETGLHFLAQLKGLDVHCAVELLLIERRLLLEPLLGVNLVAAAPAAVISGFELRDYPPPRRA